MKLTPSKLIASAVLMAVTPLAAQAAGESELAAAQEAVADYRYGLAFEHFRAAAEQGNGQGQRTTGLMALYGDRLYGSEVRRDRSEAVKWFNRAAAQGCVVSRYMLDHLANHAGEPSLTLAAAALAGKL
jgi:TPR repeat protein